MLSRPLRLTRTAEYRAVYEGGLSVRSQSLVCLALELPDEPTRAGVVASRRVGGAVVRNRAKRRLRHALRAIWESLPKTGFHIVLVATVGTGKVDYAQLLADLRRSLNELGVVQAIEPAAPTRDPQTDFGNTN